MDFGDILDDWEKLSARPGGLDPASEAEKKLKDEEARARAEIDAQRRRVATVARKSLSSWLDEYGVEDKDREGLDASPAKARADKEAQARRLRLKKADAAIDLHGMIQAQAETALGIFLEVSARKGLEKVLVITGKGIHSEGEPILGKVARRVIESSPFAGRFGTADSSEGGAGALYVVLKR